MRLTQKDSEYKFLNTSKKFRERGQIARECPAVVNNND